MRPSIATTAAAILAAGLALAACSGSDKAEVHQAGSDLKSAGKATESAVKDLASAATHDLKSAGDRAASDVHHAAKDSSDKHHDSHDTGG